MRSPWSRRACPATASPTRRRRRSRPHDMAAIYAVQVDDRRARLRTVCGAQGGDWGCDDHLLARAIDHPENGWPRSISTWRGCGPNCSSAQLDPEEKAPGWRRSAARGARETGYQLIQATKPQTLSYGLTDSPIGPRCLDSREVPRLDNLRARMRRPRSIATTCSRILCYTGWRGRMRRVGSTARASTRRCGRSAAGSTGRSANVGVLLMPQRSGGAAADALAGALVQSSCIGEMRIGPAAISRHSKSRQMFVEEVRAFFRRFR